MTGRTTHQFMVYHPQFNQIDVQITINWCRVSWCNCAKKIAKNRCSGSGFARKLYPVCTRTAIALQAILVHDPVGFLSLGGSATVENKCLLHAHQQSLWPVAHHIPVLACGLPVARIGGSVGSHPSWVLPVSQAEEIPLLLPHLRLVCKIPQKPTHIISK